MLIKKLNYPQEILYFFYGGNNLTKNIILFLKDGNTNIKSYFENEIKRLSIMSNNKINYEVNFLIISYVKILSKKIFLQISNIKSYQDLVSHLNHLLSRIKGKEETMIRNYNSDKLKKNMTHNNFIFPQIEFEFTLLDQKHLI